MVRILMGRANPDAAAELRVALSWEPYAARSRRNSVALICCSPCLLYHDKGSHLVEVPVLGDANVETTAKRSMQTFTPMHSDHCNTQTRKSKLHLESTRGKA